jgi:DNA-binding SARP family transcriptional activator
VSRPLSFGVLGPVAAWDGDGELSLGGPKQRAVLASMLLRPNELVPTSSLVEALWGAEPPPSAVRVVQGYVWALRRILGKDVLETRPGGYVLRVEPGTFDTRSFEDLREQGRRLLAQGPVEQAAASLRQALALWRGPAFGDLGDAAFAQGEVRRLDELRVETLELRLEAELELGVTAAVVGELEALVQAHPGRDRLRELLMLALCRAGRPGDALALYRRTRAMLADELGLEPSASLRRLEQAIRRHDPALGPVATPYSPPLDAAVEVRKTVTVVFCDSGGESRVFEIVSAVVERYGGSIDWIAGDEAMAVFGIPRVREDDALRAVRAAVELRDALSGLGVPPRVGMDTGEVLADSAGGAILAGRPVTLARRLVRAAAPGQVLIGESTLPLVAAFADVRRVEPSAGLNAFRVVAVDAPAERPHTMPFVGRAPELEALRSAWERVLAGRRCELVTVVGDAGIGKSRLAAELVRSLDAAVVRGRCLPYGEAITYWPVVEVLKQLDVLPADHTTADTIRALLDGAGPVPRTEEIARAFRKALETAAAGRPLAIVLEDVHWSEEAFLDLVEQVALLSSDAPILLLCLARPELVERRPSLPVTLGLAPLDDVEVGALIPRRIAGRLRERIVRAVGGNPLYLEGLIAMVDDSDGELVVPPTLQAVLAARLEQLDPSEVALLERGAVEGESFHWGAVEHLADGDPHVAQRLVALVRHGLIRRERMLLTGEDGFVFAHQLIRDAAYGRIPKARRAELHERFAAWQAERRGASPVVLHEVLGYHLEQAHRYRAELAEDGAAVGLLAKRAAHHLGLAGRHASDRGDADAAVNLLGRATTLLPGDSLERLRLLLPQSYAVHQTGRALEARKLRGELFERATAREERGLAAHARGWELVARLASDPAVDLDEAASICEQALETFAELRDDAGLALSFDGLGRICRVRGREAEATDWFERALVHANASGDVATRRLVTQAVAQPLRTGPMPVADAIRRCEELRAENAADQVLDAAIARVLSSLYAMACRFDEARACWEQAALVLDETNTLTHSWATRAHAAHAKELAGDRAGAERELRAQWRSFGGTLDGAPNMRAMFAAYDLANFYCDEGRWDEAEECLAFQKDVTAPSHVPPAALRLAATARVLARRGALDAAMALAQDAVELAETTDMLNVRAAVWLALAEVQRAAGRTADSEALAAALALYEQKGNVVAAARVRGLRAAA